MIDNFPEKFPSEKLGELYFGNVEPTTDRILLQTLCNTSQFEQIFNSEKSLVIGSQGTGKSTLFTLARDHKTIRKRNNKRNKFIIPIDERFQYSVLHEKIKKVIKSNIDNDRFRFHIIWEFLIFYRILSFLSVKNLLPSELSKVYEKLKKIIGNKADLTDLLSSTKATIGVKFEGTENLILPGVYMNAEPAEGKSEELVRKKFEQVNIDLDEYKVILNSHLQSKGINLDVVLDRLDEFVSVAEEGLQLESLSALVEVENEYSRYSNVRLVLFLRDDLFEKISYQPIGYNKIASKCFYLTWSPEHIFELIARRIIYNYAELFDLRQIRFNDELIIRTHKYSKSDEFKDLVILNTKKMLLAIVNKIFTLYDSNVKPKHTEVNDRVSSEIIVSFFPRIINLGEDESVEVHDFLIDYFSLANNKLIPRFYIIFFKLIVAKITSFYQKNPDLIELNYNHQYGQFLTIHNYMIVEAYTEFRFQIFRHFQESHPEHKENLRLISESGRPQITADELSELLGMQSNKVKDFCFLFSHLGVVEVNSRDNILLIDIPRIFRGLRFKEYFS